MCIKWLIRYKVIDGVFILMLSLLLLSCVGNTGDVRNEESAELPDNFSVLSDTAKIAVLLDAGVQPDSIASFVLLCAQEHYPGVTVTDYKGVKNYVERRLGKDGVAAYTACLEANMQTLPLSNQYLLKRSMHQVNPSMLGYTLGLEYVTRVADMNLSIGKVDFEVAELNRACADDEDIYKDFLTGFSAGIQAFEGDGISDEIVKKYGK